MKSNILLGFPVVEKLSPELEPIVARLAAADPETRSKLLAMIDIFLS